MSNCSNTRQQAEVRHSLLFLLLLYLPSFFSTPLLSTAGELRCFSEDNKSIPWNIGFSTLIKHIPHVWVINRLNVAAALGELGKDFFLVGQGWGLQGSIVSSVYTQFPGDLFHLYHLISPVSYHWACVEKKRRLTSFGATGALCREHFDNVDIQGHHLIMEYGAGLRSASDLAWDTHDHPLSSLSDLQHWSLLRLNH